MKKSTIAIIIGSVLVLIIAVSVWLIVASLSKHTAQPVENPNVVDMTGEKDVRVIIRDLSYTPSAIKVKKGTKVTWVNQDSTGHNVVADDAPDTGGIPKTAPLAGRGQTQTVTFARVGTFNYHCTPHAFMRGSVQVVD
jgi:plastocyanin